MTSILWYVFTTCPAHAEVHPAPHQLKLADGRSPRIRGGPPASGTTRIRRPLLAPPTRRSPETQTCYTLIQSLAISQRLRNTQSLSRSSSSSCAYGTKSG